MPKQQWVYFVCFAFMSTAIISPVSVLAADIAQVVFDPAHLNGREETVRDSLLAWQYSVTLIDTANATYENLAAYTATVATDNGHLDSSVINALITNGRGVAMLYSAGIACGGTWYYHTDLDRLTVASNNAFLHGYGLGTDSYHCAYSGHDKGYCTVDPPAGWISLGHRENSPGIITALYREESGKGTILGYNPYNYAPHGCNIFKRMMRYVSNETIVTGIIIPSNNVGFIIYSPDDITPELLYIESTVRDSLIAMGNISITYISASRTTVSDYSQAKFVIAVNNYMGQGKPDSLINSGVNVALLCTAGKACGGTWYHYNSNPSANRLCVEAAEGFLTDYTVGDTLTMQSSNTCCINGGITAWNSIGHNLINTDYKTALYKEVVERQSDTTRAAILTYHPFYYTNMGFNVFNDLILWLGGLVPTFEKKVEDYLPADISIYPSPVSNRLHLNLNIKEKTVLVMKIYDIEGRFVSGITQEITNPGHFQKECDIRTLPAGVYFIQISVNDRQICKKIIVTR